MNLHFNKGLISSKVMFIPVHSSTPQWKPAYARYLCDVFVYTSLISEQKAQNIKTILIWAFENQSDICFFFFFKNEVSGKIIFICANKSICILYKLYINFKLICTQGSILYYTHCVMQWLFFFEFFDIVTYLPWLKFSVKLSCRSCLLQFSFQEMSGRSCGCWDTQF